MQLSHLKLLNGVWPVIYLVKFVLRNKLLQLYSNQTEDFYF